MLKGFKDFILRGNVIDLAVAVVIGTAFTAIVTAVVNSIITPLVSLFFKADAAGNFGPQVESIYGETVTFPIGDLISAIISFLSVALVVYFVFVLPMNTFKAHVEARKGTPPSSRRRSRPPRPKPSCSSRSATCSPGTTRATDEKSSYDEAHGPDRTVRFVVSPAESSGAGVQ